MAAKTLDHQRWIEAVPKLCMALTEAGYPAVQTYDDEMQLNAETPEPVLHKAFVVCGIEDMWHSVMGGE